MKKCLTVVWSSQTLRPNLARQQFTVSTDHNPLHWISSLSEASTRLISWLLFLSEFDLDVQYKKKVKICQPDALLGQPTNAKAGTSTSKRNISTFEAPDVGSCNFTYFGFIANDTLLVAHATINKKLSYAPIGLATIVQ